MKHLKHVLASAVVLFMALVLAVPAFAYEISVKDGDTHEYKVFQVLTGTQAAEGDEELGNPAWGADATAAAKATKVEDFIDAITEEGLSKQDIAQLVASKVDITADGRGTVKAGAPLTNLPTGYYVLVDVTEIEESEDGTIDTKAMHVIRVLSDIDGMEIKYGTTESDKEIVSDTLGTDENEVNGDVDNVSIGDTVNFRIDAAVPANANLYNYFYFVINDTLDPGLTLNANSITVYALDKPTDALSNDNKLTVTTDYLVKTGTAAAPKSFQVGLVDGKSLAGKTIVVTYSAVLNENATIGEVPNKNTSTVTFSNDPNHDYNGEPENPKPGFPDEEDLEVTGETPPSVTETYTTGIEIQKVDQDGFVLTGATFKITGDNTEIVLVTEETFAEATDGTGTYYKLKDGSYTTQAPVTDDYMKEAAAGATKGYVVAEADYQGTDTVTIGETTYRPYKSGDTGTVYILVKANSDRYENDGKMYKKTVKYIQKDTTGEGAVNAEIEVGPDGVVRFVGLGEGEYTITETVTPAGYNTIDPITVKIDFVANPETGAYHWKKEATDTSQAQYNPTTGVFDITIQNNKGTELPETGGMGTTILYVVGGCMVVAGVVMFLAKRRMANVAE